VAYDFAYYLSEKGFYITSGLAHGIDEAAHRGGLAHHRTIAVTGTGLDTFIRSNKQLAQQITQQVPSSLSFFQRPCHYNNIFHDVIGLLVA
jgi:predicted Rossmann fold nucleotide-binding protein DprA/Smf involved in DNA uptake